jgi:metallo-beta-lactamase family protein
MAHTAQIVHTAEESRLLNARRGPMAIISASGGRVLHWNCHMPDYLESVTLD